MSLRITGRNRNEIKDYLYQTFDEALEYDLGPTIEYDRLISQHPELAATYEVKRFFDDNRLSKVQVAGFGHLSFDSWDEARLWAIEDMQRYIKAAALTDTLARANR